MTTTNQYYVYRHFINDNTFYVGSNSSDPNRAWNKKGRNKVWREIVNSNQGQYEVEIISFHKTKREALDAETELQKYYWSLNQCQACLQHSYEARKKISEANSGEKNGMYGARLSDEAIETIRRKATGRKKSKEEVEKLRKANLGKTVPNEIRKKISKSVSEAKKESRTIVNVETEETVSFNSVHEARVWIKNNLNAGRHVQNMILYNQREFKNWKLLEDK